MDISSEKHISHGLTLTEMVIALSIISVVFAAVVPQFQVVLKSWDGRSGDAEAMQNGRVLMSHIQNHLSKATNVTGVSGIGESEGFIEFEDEGGIAYRYEVGSDGYVRFGEVGDTADLAGPVSQLQFSCYGLADMDNATVETSVIRAVKVDTAIVNAADSREDVSLTAKVYLQVGSGGSSGLTKESSFEFDTVQGKYPELAEIGAGQYLCVYQGSGRDGWAMVLSVNDKTWKVSARSAYEFDTKNCSNPSVIQIDQSHYLCAYAGDKNDGWAVVLTVNAGSGTISKETAFEFDTKNGSAPVLARIDANNYLCVYAGSGVDGWATILNVNTNNWKITKKGSFEFDRYMGLTPAIVQIDANHYLCTYTGNKYDGWAVVLSVNAGSGTISKGSSFEFDKAHCQTPALSRIDGEHYLCAYTGDKYDGWATVLTVNPSTWRISRGLKYEFSQTIGHTPALSQIDAGRYLCTYSDRYSDGWAKILTVDTRTWEVGESLSLEYDVVKGKNPALWQIDEGHWLCVYTGNKYDGWSAILSNGGGIEP